jgi:ElaA protein
MMDIVWRLARFEALRTIELYELLQLRSEVFVVEQACAFQDMDGLDMAGWHLLGTRGRALVCYARCLPAGEKYAEASIGRVIVRADARSDGLGHVLMQQAIAGVTTLWGDQPVRIGAQERLASFYEQHGFARAGAPYVEDGIPHIEMLRAATATSHSAIPIRSSS